MKYTHHCPAHGWWGHEECTLYSEQSERRDIIASADPCPKCPETAWSKIQTEWEYEDDFAHFVKSVRDLHAK